MRRTHEQPLPADWQLLLAQTIAGSAFFIVFVLFSPFTAVRDLVGETTADLHLTNRAKTLASLRRAFLRN